MRRLAASQRQKVKVKGKDSRTEKEPSTTPEHDGQQRPRQGQFFSGAEASGLLTATELQSKLDAYRDTECSFEGNAPPECLAAWRLGDEIDRRIADKSLRSAKALFKEWDLDGDGTLSREEFRTACRRLHLVSASDAELAVNILFSVFDVDAGGTIDVDEFMAGIDTIKSRAMAAIALRSEFDLEVGRLRGRVATCERALEATAAFEVARKELRTMVRRPSIESRVARRIKTCRVTTPASLWCSLERTRDGRLELRPQGDGKQDQTLSQLVRRVPRLLLHHEVVDGLRAIVPDAGEEELAAMVDAFAARSQYASAGNYVRNFVDLETLGRELKRLESTVDDETQLIHTRRTMLREMRSAVEHMQRDVREQEKAAEGEREAREALAERVAAARELTTAVTLKALEDATEARLAQAELAAKEAARVFKHFDADGNGNIDVNELADALNQLGTDAGDNQKRNFALARSVMRRYDTDGSGFLDFEQFRRFVDDQGKLASAEARGRKKGGNGSAPGPVPAARAASMPQRQDAANG